MISRSDFDLIIRAQRAEDWEQLYAGREEAGVRYNTLAIPFMDPIRFRERSVSTPPPNEHRIVAEAVFHNGTRRVIGNLGLHRGRLSESHSAAIGINVNTDFQGMGIGSALMAAMCDLADNWLNLHRVELDVFTDNRRGIALYKKFGFETEATLQRMAFRDGVYVDALLMARLHPRHIERPAL